ncbi:MAG: hypothetical protein NC097_07365 [Clostridium sp.]|nr:hypothetical protein [Prevotella sp.]MCM1429595.1 hypothetical protein [Clostridium sp.]MCM1476074.1 hypothetical protein [Muribaculaceae bacterium]
MKQTVLKWLLLTVLIAYAVGMAVWANARAAEDICSGISVKIEGATMADSLTIQGVMAELSRCPVKIEGERLGKINTLAIENYLKSLSNFEDVECVLNSKGKLTVKIVPMIPEIRIFDGSQSYYVNKDGKRINSKAEFYSDVPIVSGHFSKQLPPVYILPVSRFVASDSLMKNLVGQIVVHDRNNILLIPRMAGHVINIGDTSRLAEKRSAILTAYRNILPYRGWETYDTISVKFRGQIVATRRDKTPLHPAVAIEESENPEEASLSQETPAPEKPQRDI